MNMTGRFYYSDNVANAELWAGGKRTVKKCLLEDGSVRQYTEWVSDNGEPLTKWHDLAYLGRGIVLSIDGVRQVTDAEIRQWKRRISRHRRIAILMAVFFGKDK